MLQVSAGQEYYCRWCQQYAAVTVELLQGMRNTDKFDIFWD